MPKSTKEPAVFDDTAYHFPTHYLFQQFHSEEIDIPKEFLNVLKQNKKVTKCQIKIYPQSLTITDRKKREVEIYRIRRYLSTEKDNIIILLVNGLNKETASLDALRFKTKEIGDRFIEKLTECKKAIEKDEEYSAKIIQPYYRNSIAPSDNTSVRTKNSLYRQLSDEDFSTYSKRKSLKEEALPEVDDTMPDENEQEKELDPKQTPAAEFQPYDVETEEKPQPEIAPLEIPVVATAPKRSSITNAPVKTRNLVLSDDCDMSKVHAPEYTKFPRTLPSNLYSDLETQRLQYTGEFRVYDDQVEFFDKHSKEILFKAPYSEIENVHEFSNQPTNLLLFRNDATRRVSQMVLLNFDSRKTTKNAVNNFKNNDIDVFLYTPKEDARKPVEVSREPEVVTANFSAPVQRANRNSNSFNGGMAKFDSMKMKRSFSKPETPPQFDESALKRLPDDGVWDYDLVYLNFDPEDGCVVSDNGPIYMFCAHRMD